MSKKSFSINVKNTKFITFTSIIIFLIILIFIIFQTFLHLNTQFNEKISAFQKNNILIESDSELKAEFIEKNKLKNFEFPFTINNQSKYDYQLKIQAQHNEISDFSEKYEIKSQDKQKINLKTSLEYLQDNKKTDISFSITTEFKQFPFSETYNKTLHYSFPINLVLLDSDEIIKLEVEPINNTLQYSQNSHPELKINMVFHNFVDKNLNNFIYELDLYNKNGNKVQPLLFETINLKPEQQIEIEKSFQFNLPPADLIKIGKNSYKLKLTLKGSIGEREFSIEKISSQDLSIQVNSF